MADIKTQTPFSDAARLVTALPNWLNEYDAQRLAAYQLYEDIYWTKRGTFVLTQRGSEENPIYLPSGRIIVNTMNRYVAKGWQCTLDPDYGTDAEKDAAKLLLEDFFKRERFKSQFKGAKKYGLIRGDWAFYITGDPDRLPGRRLTLRSIDPGMMFPITAKDDVDRVIGVDLIEQIVEGSNSFIQKQRYLKSIHPEHPSGGVEGLAVSYEKVTLEIENWETEPKIVRKDVPITLLEGNGGVITNLPVYHIKNGDYEPGNPFGYSEMRGLERVMAALNQSITDEELALALDGLGMYKSDKGQPKNAANQPIPWALGPGRVVHDSSFDRVQGVGSVTPFTSHMDFLKGEMYEASGTNDVARGIVDVKVAESGVALALRMGPILGEAEEKDTGITEVMDNLLFDLKDWFQVYEADNTLANVRPISELGPKLPENKKERFDNILAALQTTPPLISMGTAREWLRDEFGWDIPANEMQNVLDELLGLQEAADQAGSRLEQEAAGASDEVDVTEEQ